MLQKVDVSISYKNEKEIIEISKTITLPKCSREFLQHALSKRIVPVVIAEDKTLKPIDVLRTVYIESEPEDVKGFPSFEGKSIKKLNWRDIEEVAVAYELAGAPAYKQMDLSAALKQLYAVYSKKVLGKVVDRKVVETRSKKGVVLTSKEIPADFDLSTMPDVIFPYSEGNGPKDEKKNSDFSSEEKDTKSKPISKDEFDEVKTKAKKEFNKKVNEILD